VSLSTEKVGKRKALTASLLFAGVAVGLSCTYWLLFVLSGRGLLPFDPSSSVLGTLRGYIPTIAALVTALAVFGRPELSSIWARVSKWRVSPRLYGLALLVPMGASLIVVLMARLSGTEVVFDPEGTALPKLVLIFVFFAIVDGPLGEEIGWRGFFLPKLLDRWGPIAASLILGVVWFLWHLPLYMATGRFEMTLAFLVGYLINNVSFSVLHTWFFLRSGGSAFLAIFFHTAGNYFVFLVVTLFPALEGAPTTRLTHLGVIALAAVCAGLSLSREGSR
jgi:membrane protease YdiL (CAAX protease family)